MNMKIEKSIATAVTPLNCCFVASSVFIWKLVMCSYFPDWLAMKINESCSFF